MTMRSPRSGVEEIAGSLDGSVAGGERRGHDRRRQIAARDGGHPMQQSGQKVHGPYPHRTKWRLVVRAADGSQKYVAFATEGQARAHKTKLLKEIAGRTVSDAVQDFVVEQRESGLRSGTVKVSEFRLRAFFQLDAEVDGRTMPYAETGGLLESLQPRAASSCTGRW
jgi:hypothetical protein